VGAFASRLCDWFERHGRHDLPWQRNASPYAVWVSEIMLQQTQVATVIPYFERFMRRFPAIADLAAAEQDEVLGHWSGLGYYARARNLHRAARIVVDEHDGERPVDPAMLVELPGIGRSTAGAIVALANGVREPILDGNVKRVLARYHGIEGWPGNTAVLKQLWSLAETHTPTTNVAAYTQAIMDLGAKVCTRARPDCSRCPIAEDCVAARDGRQSELPSPRPRRVRPQREVRVVVVKDKENRILLERRPEVGVWGGLYSLPELSNDEEPRAWCARSLNARVDASRELPRIDHAFTHFELAIAPTLLELEDTASIIMDRADRLWYKPGMQPKLGLAAPIAALLNTICATDGYVE
jgi:A/G-specific adenine glycosylase